MINADRRFLNEITDGRAVMLDGSEVPCKVIRFVVERGGVQDDDKPVVAIRVDDATHFPNISELGIALLDKFQVFQVYEDKALIWETTEFPIIKPKVSRRYILRFGGRLRLMRTPQGFIDRLYDINNTLRAIVKEVSDDAGAVD